MANLTDTTYFAFDLKLPTDELKQLTGFITRFEPDILIKSLGYDLKKAYVEALAGTPASKWTDLKNGKEYQENGIWYNWRGMVNTQKESFLSCYIYYMFSVEGWQLASSVGLKAINTENSVNVSPRAKQCYVYNLMIDWIKEMDKFIIAMNALDSTTYPNYNPEKFYKINPFNI